MTDGVERFPILLVEDEENDYLLLKRAFERAGLVNPLVWVRTGDEAVKYLKRQPPYDKADLYPMPTFILLDLKMPGMNGFEFLQWLRAEPELKKLIVVVFTSSRESPDVNRAYELGANSYLLKPVSFDDLMRLVRELHLYWLVMNEGPEIKPQ